MDTTILEGTIALIIALLFFLLGRGTASPKAVEVCPSPQALALDLFFQRQAQIMGTVNLTPQEKFEKLQELRAALEVTFNVRFDDLVGRKETRVQLPA